MKNTLLFAVLLLGLVATNITAQNSGPAAAVTSFYKYDWSHSQIFNRRNLDARKQWLSPGLYNLFREELVKEQKMLAEHPTDKPFFGDGFPFVPLRESYKENGKPCSRLYRVGTAKLQGNKALVDVRFFYAKHCNDSTITYVVELVRVKSGWRIDDLLFQSGDRLSENMKSDH